MAGHILKNNIIWNIKFWLGFLIILVIGGDMAEMFRKVHDYGSNSLLLLYLYQKYPVSLRFQGLARTSAFYLQPQMGDLAISPLPYLSVPIHSLKLCSRSWWWKCHEDWQKISPALPTFLLLLMEHPVKDMWGTGGRLLNGGIQKCSLSNTSWLSSHLIHGVTDETKRYPKCRWEYKSYPTHL